VAPVTGRPDDAPLPSWHDTSWIVLRDGVAGAFRPCPHCAAPLRFPLPMYAPVTVAGSGRARTFTPHLADCPRR